MPNLDRIQSPGIINQDLNEESSKSKALSPIHNCESSIKNITIEPMAGLDSTSHIPKTSMASSMINNHGGTDIQDQLTNEKVVDTAKVEGHGPDKVYKDKSSMINGPENVPDSKGNAIALIANDYKVSHARSAHHNTESGLVNGVMGEADAGETGDKVTSSARASTAAAIQETTEVPHLAGSLPPPRRHRSKLQALLPPQYGLRESKQSAAATDSSLSRNHQQDHHRSSRPPQSPHAHRLPRHNIVDREETARMHAQLLSLKKGLEAERKTNITMRKTIEAEQQQKSHAAFTSVLSNLLRDQEEALLIKARAEAKERDLEVCSKRIEQLEIYLSVGQKQLFLQLKKAGICCMDAVTQEHIKRDAVLAVQKQYTDQIGALNTRMERIRHREATQELREAQYKISIRDALEAELCQTTISSERANEIAESEYNSGFAAGKEAGLQSALEDARRIAFLEGYAACHRTFAAVDDLRHGRITPDDPKLAFLFDIGNPENLIARGIEIGQMNKGDCGMSSTHGSELQHNGNNVIASETRIANGVIAGEATIDLPHYSSNITNGVGNGALSNGIISKNVLNDDHLSSPSTITPPSPLSRAENAEPQNIPPSRLTLAAELRGTPVPTYNGQAILANHTASSIPAAPLETNGMGQSADIGPDLIDLH